MSSTSTRAALTGRVIDFYRQFAPNDISKASIALGMNIPKAELFTMLAEKYNVDVAKVRARLELYDTVEEYFRRHAPSEMSQVEVAMKLQCEPEELLRKVRMLVTRTQKTSSSPARGDRVSPGRASATTPSNSNRGLSSRHLLPPQQDGADPVPDMSPPPPTPPVVMVSRLENSTMTHTPAVVATAAIQATSDEDKTATMIAREEALNARSLALSVLSPGSQIVAAEGVEDRHVEIFYRKLVSIEGELFSKLVQLEQHEDAQTREKQILREKAARQETEDARLRQLSAQVQDLSHQAEIEAVKRKTQFEHQSKEFLDQEARAAERQRALDRRELATEVKEKLLLQAQHELTVKEHNVAAQLKLIEQERDLCKRLSTEVLKREATVRQVEKALVTAKQDLDRLENDLTGRAKKLMADEASVKKWAVELERREMTLQSIVEQLQLKGIQVSVQ